jgi:glycosyltransferase involved in cell wall biosynthesis
MLASVVIVNYNYGMYLRDAINSALKQSYGFVDVVVVDDGSTDDSVTIARGYGSKITLIEQNNLGHVKAVNAGFAACKGDVVIFLDADDILYPDCLARVVANWSGGLAKVQYRLNTIDKAGVDQKMSFPHYPEDMVADDVRQWSLRFGWYPWPVSTGNAYARGFLEKLLPIPNPPIYKSPDGYLNRMVPLYGEVRTLSEILGAYRVHGHNRWAQAGASQIARVSEEWLHFDKILATEFAQRAKALGYESAVYDNLISLQRIEYRFLAKIFASGFEDRSVIFLLRTGFVGALRAPYLMAIGRIAWMGWFLVLAVFPKSLVASIFVKARGQIGRTALSKLVVRLSRSRAQS